jgi:hypothetical protein
MNEAADCRLYLFATHKPKYDDKGQEIAALDVWVTEIVQPQVPYPT